MVKDDHETYSRKNLIIEKFDLTNGQEEILQQIQNLTDQGLIGSYYEIDKNNPNIRYIGFEKDVISTESEDQELIAA